MLSSSSSHNDGVDEDVKLRHRNVVTVVSSTKTSSSRELSNSEQRRTFHTEEKSPSLGNLIDNNCRTKASDLVESNHKPLMDESQTGHQLSESSDEVTTVSDCMEYKEKPSSSDKMRSSVLHRQTSQGSGAGSTAQGNTMSTYINIFVEVAVRLLLFYGTSKLERTDSFKRKIHPEEIWLYKNPMSKDYVPASTALFWIVVAPLVLITSNFLLCRNKKEFRYAISALTLGLAMTAFTTSLLKVSVGRPRPDFFYRCFPDGVIEDKDFDQCTGDKKVIEEGRKSFPSGHSSMSFAAFGFMSYYLASKLHVFNERGRGKSWRLCVSLVPLFVALEVAVSRTCDYHHHWQDVLVGSLIGICLSYLCYRQYYPSIFSTNCHRAYSSRGSIVRNQTNCVVSSGSCNVIEEDTDENQPLISGGKENKWI